MNEAVSLMNRLVSVDSSKREGANAAVEQCAGYLEEHGITGNRIDNEGFSSYVAVTGSGAGTLVLNGHLDVVSGREAQFVAEERGGRIYGRGTADMKGGCAAMMQAFIALSRMDLKSRVMLQLVPDEETGGRRGTAFLVDQGYVGDFVICTEPTNMKVSIQSKGVILLDIITTGVSAHGSRPWEGENAILKALENYRRVSQLPILEQGSQFYDRSTVNLARISGGNIYNRVPDSCTIGLDIRFVPSLDPRHIIAAIEGAVDGSVNVRAMEAGVNVDPENGYVKLLQNSLSRVVASAHIGPAVQHGGSDARFFAAAGIPAVEFGPRGGAWHGDGEYVESSSLEELEKVLIDFALRFHTLNRMP
jgi:succinyl-diaminopimelate desuccinylase